MGLRYKLTPQMKEYDKLGIVWVPYLMYFHTPNYVSNIVNTDSRGLRITYRDSTAISDITESDDWKSLLFGDSATFGIGVTHDKNTIPSILNLKSRYLWLNFGARAFGLTQSFLLFLFYCHRIKNIKNIVLLSGITDLFLSYMSRDYPKDLGSFFLYSHYNKVMNQKPLSFKRKTLKFFLDPYYGDRIDYSRLSAKDLRNYIFSRKRESTEIERSLDEYSIFENMDIGAKTEELLFIFDRNISAWKRLADMRGIKLYYVLQPLANWIRRKLSEEEKALFSELDALPDNHWRLLKDKFNEDLRSRCVFSMKKICESHKVSFFDMNKAISETELDGKWLFTDRVHLTDEGSRIVAEILHKEIID